MSVPLFTPSYLSLYLASKTLDMDYFCVLRESAYNYINTFYEQSLYEKEDKINFLTFDFSALQIISHNRIFLLLIELKKK